MSQPSRRSPRGTTRRQRRESNARTYSDVSFGQLAAQPQAPRTSPAPRRSYQAAPTPVDYSTEFRYIRKDLVRILIWATVLIGAMVLLAFLPIFR